MPYAIFKTDGTQLIQIADDIIDHTYSLSFAGIGNQQYAKDTAENFLHLLENFASTISPATPLQGQIWYDKNTNQLKVFRGNALGWKSPAGPTYVTDIAPITPEPGDIWWDTVNITMKVWTGAQWQGLGAASGGPTSTDATTLNGFTAADFIKTTGGTMHGPLILGGDPQSPLHASTKQYVDNRITSHNHDLLYAAIVHAHDGIYSPIGHTHTDYAPTSHNHDGVYSPTNHLHDGVYGRMDSVNIWNRAQRCLPQTLVDAAVVGMDVSLSNFFLLTMDGPDVTRVLQNPVNAVSGQQGIVVVKNPGSKLLTFDTNWKFPGGFQPSVTNAVNAIDVISYYILDPTTILTAMTRNYS
jgi:hypothetical protein